MSLKSLLNIIMVSYGVYGAPNTRVSVTRLAKAYYDSIFGWLRGFLENQQTENEEIIVYYCAGLMISNNVTDCYLDEKLISIDEKISHGANGDIYTVYCNDSIYILKQFHSENTDHRYSQYMHELNVLMENQDILSIPRFYGNQDGTYPCILIEYIENGDLLDYVTTDDEIGIKKFNPNEIANISLQYMIDIGTVVQRLNQNRLMHMDIKLDNILYKWDNDTYIRFYLTDFALVIPYIDGHCEAVSGSLYYLSPEQARCLVGHPVFIPNVACIDRYTMVFKIIYMLFKFVYAYLIYYIV